ncbi:MAG: hypothetical protein IPN86_24225 [Saprospiraceae bacterium]|nr:hypothetical protein [Saprospiraceae bacterium]
MDAIRKDVFIGFGLINLTIVAFVGMLMRYKIGFEFPYLSQKYLLHGHSHFAFSGWVTHILFTFLVLSLGRQIKNAKIFNNLIVANLLCAFGMLIAFIIQGYGTVSITFSTLSIFIGYIFAYYYYKELQGCQGHPSHQWFKAALFFNILSSLGTFYLAYMMVSKNIDQHAYLGSVYFYLHFQYSGWFFFTIIGLIISKFATLSDFVYKPSMFYFFFIACFPAYFLSILWANLPWYLYILPIGAVALQLFGLYELIKLILRLMQQIRQQWAVSVQWLLGMALVALVIKILLQTGSVIPAISKLAFGFRSIVIAYLHLVLLGFTSLFLLGYMKLEGHISSNKNTIRALIIFTICVFANELVLTLQGVASFAYILIPYANEMLFVISAIMFLSMIGLIYFHKKT